MLLVVQPGHISRANCSKRGRIRIRSDAGEQFAHRRTGQLFDDRRPVLPTVGHGSPDDLLQVHLGALRAVVTGGGPKFNRDGLVLAELRRRLQIPKGYGVQPDPPNRALAQQGAGDADGIAVLGGGLRRRFHQHHHLDLPALQRQRADRSNRRLRRIVRIILFPNRSPNRDSVPPAPPRSETRSGQNTGVRQPSRSNCFDPTEFPALYLGRSRCYVAALRSTVRRPVGLPQPWGALPRTFWRPTRHLRRI